MSTAYIAEIRLFAFGFAPKGWLLCEGQLLAINQNQPLFSLLGTTYGGDGRVTFGLPDLRGRAPMHVDSIGGTQVLGESGGESSHTLTTGEIPAHTHVVSARSSASASSPAGAAWAGSVEAAFAATPTVTMAASSIATAGGSEPHSNMPPYLVLNFAIALQGIFPSRS